MDLSSLNQFGPWGILIAAAIYFLYQRKQPTTPPTPTPTPGPTPAPSPSTPDPQSNPLAYLIWVLMQQWLQPSAPSGPVQPSAPQFQSVESSSPTTEAAEAALANVIRADPGRRERMVKLLAK